VRYRLVFTKSFYVIHMFQTDVKLLKVSFVLLQAFVAIEISIAENATGAHSLQVSSCHSTFLKSLALLILPMLRVL
jgi:hypothetical protein